MNVDHIKPLHKRWDLRLSARNLQTLCASCNWGKGVSEKDFRRPRRRPRLKKLFDRARSKQVELVENLAGVKVHLCQFMNEELCPPASTPLDTAHALVKGCIGAIPIAGSVAAEIFGLLIKPPLTRKMEAWMVNVSTELCRLSLPVSLQALSEDEGFASFLLAASLQAMKTQEGQKIDALRNAVLNYALQLDRNAAQLENDMYLLDRLTTAHVIVLRAFSDYETRIATLKQDGAEPAMPLASEFPALSADLSLANRLLSDLVDLHLVSMPGHFRYGGMASKPLWTNMYGHLGHQHVALTDIGRAFLKTISLHATQ